MSSKFKHVTLPLLLLSAIFITLFTGASLQAQNQQDEDPVISVKMKASDWNKIITIIHNAPINGDIRDPLINVIATQAQAQVNALKQPVDSTSDKTGKNSLDKSKKKS
jgi:hypothetical protein